MIEINNQNLRSSGRGQNFDRTRSWIEKSGIEQVSNIQISLPDQVSGFYGLKEFKFTNCGMSGRLGPNLPLCISFYNTDYNTDWVKNENYFSMPTRGIQKVTIPCSAEFEFTAFGAGWQNYGAMATSNVILEAGTNIYIGIGQRGNEVFDGCGGTFVAIREYSNIRESGKFLPIIIAGGAGGGYYPEEHREKYIYGNGSTDQFGNRSNKIEERNKKNGKAGKSAETLYYNGGNGFEGRIKGNWEETVETPQSFEDGLNGGQR